MQTECIWEQTCPTLVSPQNHSSTRSPSGSPMPALQSLSPFAQPCSSLLAPNTWQQHSCFTIWVFSQGLQPGLPLHFFVCSVGRPVLPGPGPEDHVQVCSLSQASSAPRACDLPSQCPPAAKAWVMDISLQKAALPLCPQGGHKAQSTQHSTHRKLGTKLGRIKTGPLSGCSMHCSPVCPGL